MTIDDIIQNYYRKGLIPIPVGSPKMLTKDQFKDRIEYEQSRGRKFLGFGLDDLNDLDKAYIRFCKRPLISWREFSKTRPDECVVRSWFSTNEDCNIGVIIGKYSDTFVLDLDTKDAIDWWNKNTHSQGWGSYGVVKTGKGYHIYVKGFNILPSEITSKTWGHNKLIPGTDVKFTGYVVAPDSVHGSGTTYQWIQKYNPEKALIEEWLIAALIEEYLKHHTFTEEQVDQLSGFRDNEIGWCKLIWLKSRIRTLNQLANKTELEQPGVDKPGVEQHIKLEGETKQWVKEIINSDGVSEGSRNDSLFQLTSRYFRLGLVLEEASLLAKDINNKFMKPPLSESEVEEIIKSAYRIASSSGEKPDTDLIPSWEECIELGLEELKLESAERIPFINSHPNSKNLQELSNLMGGGLTLGNLYFLGGEPNCGKTLLINNMIDYIALNQYPVVYLSADDKITEAHKRSLSLWCEGYNIHTINKIDGKKLHKLAVENPIYSKILKYKNILSEPFVQTLKERMLSGAHRFGKPVVAFIDYLRLLKNVSPDYREERLRIDKILEDLKEFAERNRFTFFIISELNRASYNEVNSRASFASFKETGYIEYLGSWLAILRRTKRSYESNAKPEDLELRKNIGDDLFSYTQPLTEVVLSVIKTKKGTGSKGFVLFQPDVDHMLMTSSQNPESLLSIAEIPVGGDNNGSSKNASHKYPFL